MEIERPLLHSLFRDMATPYAKPALDAAQPPGMDYHETQRLLPSWQSQPHHADPQRYDGWSREEPSQSRSMLDTTLGLSRGYGRNTLVGPHENVAYSREPVSAITSDGSYAHSSISPTTPRISSDPAGGRSSLGNSRPFSKTDDADDGVVDDDEEDSADGDADPSSSRTMTAAERMAAKRKMKRFRLTHQQTRFLMSEFAKQPHPDAACRERLACVIPGLTPRQVQVWFQNRRAKIKRLTVDDRERVVKMHAVPDDFDNIQALHAPYGAVHTINANNNSSSSNNNNNNNNNDNNNNNNNNNNNPSIGSASAVFGSSLPPPLFPSLHDDMIRPIIPAACRPSQDVAHLSPISLPPLFSQNNNNHNNNNHNNDDDNTVAFPTISSVPLVTPDLLSPLSTSSAPAPVDRYAPSVYGSHPPPTPATASANPRLNYGRHNSLESLGGGMHLHNHHHHLRPDLATRSPTSSAPSSSIQPLAPYKTRPDRSDSLPSPLRSNMSWKAGAISYYATTYPAMTSPQYGQRTYPSASPTGMAAPMLGTTEEQAGGSASSASAPFPNGHMHPF